MSAENQKSDGSVSQDVNSKVDASRRSFAKKSAAVAPVIMTLANRSAWGANACTGSVFNSFTGIASHGTDYQRVLVWKQPKIGLPIANKNGWYESILSWPSGYIPVKKANGVDNYTSQSSPKLWNGNNGKSNVLSFGIAFVYQLPGSNLPNTDTLTLYDALNDTQYAYFVAAALNQAETPLIPFPSLAPEEIDRFYTNCI